MVWSFGGRILAVYGYRGVIFQSSPSYQKMKIYAIGQVLLNCLRCGNLRDWAGVVGLFKVWKFMRLVGLLNCLRCGNLCDWIGAVDFKSQRFTRFGVSVFTL